MAVRAKKQPVTDPPAPPFDVGDAVFVVYHRPDGTPTGLGTAGGWELTAARVLSAGRLVCIELDGQLPPWAGGEFEAPPGSLVRFVRPDRVFLARELADQACRTLPPPGRNP